MLTKLKKMYVASFESIWQMFAIYGGIWAAFFALFSILMAVKGDDRYSGFAGLMCAVFGTMFLVMVFVMGYSVEFETAVKMSVPRKTFLALYSFINVTLCIAYAAFIILIMQLDVFLARVIFKVAAVTPASFFGMDGFMPTLKLFGVLILANIIAMILGLFIGALMLRFGKAAFWAIWALYMIFAFCGMGFGMISENPNSIVGQFFNTIGNYLHTLTPMGYGIIGGIIALLAATVSVILLRRASVKS